MPFPANWLEELIVEWLDLDGFATTTKIRVPAGPGGAWSPDVAGAKLIGRRLLIRHCECAEFLNQDPEQQAERYKRKFSDKVQKAVREHFSFIFGSKEANEAMYEKWVICCGVGKLGTEKMKQAISDLRIYQIKKFVFKDVIPTIERYRQPPNTKTTTLPADKWLLCLLDRFRQFDLINPNPD